MPYPRLRWNDNLPERDPRAGMEIVGAVLMEEAMLERVAKAIRARRHTQPMSVTLAADFDRLCDALAETEGMTVKEAFEHLRNAGAAIPMDSELKIWWLASARELLIQRAMEQESAINDA